jgi:hypothetical protein
VADFIFGLYYCGLGWWGWISFNEVHENAVFPICQSSKPSSGATFDFAGGSSCSLCVPSQPSLSPTEPSCRPVGPVETPFQYIYRPVELLLSLNNRYYIHNHYLYIFLPLVLIYLPPSICHSIHFSSIFFIFLLSLCFSFKLLYTLCLSFYLSFHYAFNSPSSSSLFIYNSCALFFLPSS